MNREEKEQHIIRLYKEGRSTREIAELVHMSFRDIGAIIKKVKSEADRERGQLGDDDDIKSKSKTTQAIKLFSELETPVEVAIALDLPADQVHAIYLEYCKLDGMYRLAQIYDEAKYDLHDLLALHRIAKDRGMEKQDIINVLEFVKHNQLRTLQAKVESLRNDIDRLEDEKTKAKIEYFRLKRMIGEAEETLAQKRKEMTHMDQESKYDYTSSSGKDS
jgi:regulator of replication initiation timing